MSRWFEGNTRFNGNRSRRTTAPDVTTTSPGPIKPFCFYKLMLSSTPYPEEMRIPESFANAFGEELSLYCRLAVPTGVTHQVKLVEKDDGLWFGNGWEQFVNCFSIRYGYFMNFIYQGNSKFRVQIFDLTTCEISYEPHNGLSQGFSMEENESEDEDKSISTSSDPGEEMTDSEPGSGSFCEIGNDPQDGLPIWLRSCEDELEALADAGISLPSENPFFVTSIKDYALHGGNFMLIPIMFAREHLKCQTRDIITVKICDGREFEIGCLRDQRRCCLSNGWIAFTREMHLEAGNVCLFELTDVENSVFELHIVGGN